MKNKLSFAMIYMCLLLLLTAGVYELAFTGNETRISQTEKRELQAFPEVSLENILSGNFMDEFELFMSDAFFARDEAADFSDNVKGLFRYGEEEKPDGLDPEQMAAPQQPVADITEETEQPAETPQAAEIAEAPAAEETQIAEVPVQEESDEELAAQYTGENLRYWLVNENGSTEILYSYDYYTVAKFAKVLNAYAECLPEGGTVHYASVPVSDQTNKIQLGSCVDWDSNLTELLQPLVNDNVYIYDGMDVLRPYLDGPYMYFTNDHHWNSYGASYVASAMVNALGTPSVDFDEYIYYLASENNDSTYTTEQLSSMTISTIDNPVMVPRTPMRYWAMYRAGEQLIEWEPIERARVGYHEYFGGILKSWRLLYTGYHTGRNALIIGDSFTNAYTFYLLPYYDTIIVADFRDESYNQYEAGASARKYMEMFDIDDIYMVTCTWVPIAGDMMQNRMLYYLDH